MLPSLVPAGKSSRTELTLISLILIITSPTQVEIQFEIDNNW